MGQLKVKITNKKNGFLIVLMLLSFAFAGNTQSLEIIKVNNKYGLYKGVYPNTVVPPVYNEIQNLGSLYLVKKGELFGLFDSTGKPVADVVYTEINQFNDQLFYARKKEFYGVMDMNGKEIIPFTASELNIITDSSEQRKYFHLKVDNDWRLYSTSGQLIYKGHQVIDKHENILAVAFLVTIEEEKNDYTPEKKEFRLKLIDTNEKINFSGIYTYLKFYKRGIVFSNGKIDEYRTPDFYGWMDYSGKKIADEKIMVQKDGTGSTTANDSYNATEPFVWYLYGQNKFRTFETPYIKKDTGYFGYWKNDQWLIKPVYLEMEPIFKQSYFAATDHSRTIVFDSTGKVIYSAFMARIKPLNQTPSYPAYVKENFESTVNLLYDAKFLNAEVLDKNFKVVVKKADAVYYTHPLRYLNHQLIPFEKDKKFGLLDEKGKIFFKPVLYNIPWAEGEYLTVRDGDYFQVYNASGKIVLKKVQRFEQMMNAPLYKFQMDGSWGIINTKGKIVLPAEYDEFYSTYWRNYAIAKNGFWHILDTTGSLKFSERFKSLKWTYDSTVIGKKENDKFVLLDRYGNIISKEYDQMDSYYEVKNKNLAGLINSKGKEMIAPAWDKILPDGSAARGNSITSLNNQYYVIDSTGKTLEGLQGDSIYYLEGFNTYAIQKNGKWESNHLTFDEIKQTRGEHQWFLNCRIGNQWGLKNSLTDEWIFKREYSGPFYAVPRFIQLDSGSTVVVHDFEFSNNGTTGIISSDGEVLLKMESDHFFSLHYKEGFQNTKGKEMYFINTGGYLDYIDLRFKGGKWGIADHLGKTIRKPNGLEPTALYYNGRTLLGFLWNEGGKESIYPADTMFNSFYDIVTNQDVMGKMVIENKRIRGGVWGIINYEGKEIIPVKYEEIKLMGLTGYDYNQREIRYSWSDSLPFEIGGAIALKPVFVKLKNKWGAYDLSGKLIIPVEYDSLQDVFLDLSTREHLIKTWKNGTFGYFDLEGKNIIPVEQTHETFFENEEKSFAIFQKGGTAIPYEVVYTSRNPYVLFNSSTGMVYDSLDANSNPVFREEIKIRHKHSDGKLGIFDFENKKWVVTQQFDAFRLPRMWTTPNGEYTYFTGNFNATNRQADYKDKEQLFMHGLIQFERNGKWGVAGSDGKEYLKPEYDSIRMDSMMFKTFKGGLCGITTWEGEVYLPCEFNEIVRDQSRFLVRKGGEKIAYEVSQRDYMPYARADSRGNIIDSVDAQGNFVYPIITQTQHYYKGAKFGLKFRDEWIFKPEYDEIIQSTSTNKKTEFITPDQWFKDETGMVLNDAFLRKGTQTFYFTNNTLTPLPYDSLLAVHKKSGEIQYIETFSKGNVGLMNINAEELIPAIAKDYYFLYDSLLLIRNGTPQPYCKADFPYEKFEKYDNYGNYFGDSLNATGEKFYKTKSMCWLYNKAGSTGIYDLRKKKQIVDFISEEILFPVFFTENIPLMHRSINDPLLYANTELIQSLYPFWILAEGKSKMIQISRDSVFVHQFEKSMYLPGIKSFKVMRNGKWGLINAAGFLILDYKFEDIKAEENTLVLHATENGNSKKYAPNGEEITDHEIYAVIAGVYKLAKSESVRYFELSSGREIDMYDLRALEYEDALKARNKKN